MVMKKIGLFIITLLMLSFFNKNDVKKTSIIITPESEISIKGKTNINEFRCHYNVLKIKKPIPIFFNIEGDKLIFKETILALQNTCFDCGNKSINKNLITLLKTKNHPKIFIHLKELEKQNKTYVSLIDIEIAGIKKLYKVPITINTKNSHCVKGHLILDIYDFNLTPAKKLFGIIKLNNLIEIDFKLFIEEQP